MFVAVADEGSFSAAARVLRVSPPAVTRGIDALETRLDVSLFHRSTRAASLTDDGATRRILSDIQDAERQGQLIEVLRTETPTPQPINLLFESARRSLPATRLFIDGMKNRAADQGLADPPPYQKV
ncbi:LysR family transcriptional regulator [Parasphingorhabdus sp.]|uniref:LysR family transcriptional regulator n=1 Tax=Parasphingorhabdus sp. TaxID=2709688 RepID=UPI003A8E3227